MAAPINITFTVGTLTPAQQYTPQELLEAFAERLLGTVDSDTLLPGESGSSAPTVNKGVFLNTLTNPETLMTWDQSLGKYVKDDAQTPIGAIIFWPGTSAVPAGYASCDGSAYNKLDYPKCYERLGGTGSPYGQTDTTFQVPDARGRTLFGLKDAWDIGQHAGNDTVELKPPNLPAHTHDLRGYGVTSQNRASRVIVDDDRETGERWDLEAVQGGGNGKPIGDPFEIIPSALVGRWIIRME